MRYALLPCYLTTQRLDGAARLFEEFDECPWNSVFAWGHVLERWLAGDTKGAEQALAWLGAQAVKRRGSDEEPE